MTEPKVSGELYIDDAAFEKLRSMINDRSLDVVYIYPRNVEGDPAIRLESIGVRSWMSEILKGPHV